MLSEVTGITEDVFAHQERWNRDKILKKLVLDEIYYINYICSKSNKIKTRVSGLFWISASSVCHINAIQDGS